METFIAIIIALGIFVVVPAVIGFLILLGYAGVLGKRKGDVQPVKRVLKTLENRRVKLSVLGMMCLYYPFIYYAGDIVDRYGWEAFRWDFFFTVHDVHRTIFLLPIAFAAYHFGWKGGAITAIFALAVFLPRAITLSPYPDPTSRMIVFWVFSLCLGIFVGILSDKLRRLQALNKTSPRS